MVQDRLEKLILDFARHDGLTAFTVRHDVSTVPSEFCKLNSSFSKAES